MLATRFARKQTGADAEILYQGLWVHRLGPYYYPDGRQFNYTSATFRHWKDLAKLYITDAEDFWLRHNPPQKGDVVIDVGAGRGESTLAFSQAVGDTGRVIAIEAHPLSFQFLEVFCSLNRLVNTMPLQLAVMDKSGMVSLVESESWWGANTIGQSNGSQGIQVRAATLDEICEAEGIKQIDFLKMNIEGAERYALLGMESVIHRVQTICVACHDFLADSGHGEQFRTRDFVEQFLTEHGFNLASRPDDHRNYVRDHVFGLR
jgi:FkbM family methyltransferase